MNPAVAKTISLLLLLGIGLLFRGIFRKPEHHTALKILILNIALPAIIFMALMNTDMKADMLWFPLAALAFNFVLLGLVSYILPKLYSVGKMSPDSRTLALLLPSLAPGMSCFPFLLEYVGKDAVALGGLADLGNKVYVLIFCYLLAMHWFFVVQPVERRSISSRMKGLVFSMAREPVNLAMVFALLLVGVGIHFQDLPIFISDPIVMLSALMTPIVLLFIGVTVRCNWRQVRLIFGLMLFRAGVTFLISGAVIFAMPNLSPTVTILAVVFPQSAVSFWPLAHISAVSVMERDTGNSVLSTFNLQLAINVLAISLPFSVVIILTVLSLSDFFVQVTNLLTTGSVLLSLAIVPVVLYRLRTKSKANSLSKNSGFAAAREEN